MEQQAFKLNIQTLITKGKMFQAIIITSRDYFQTNAIANDVARMFFCEQQSINDDHCRACKRFKTNNLLDFRRIGDGHQAINKHEIQTMLKQFSLTSVEQFNKKVYLINCAENLKIDAANALLKFLEEPPTNTYAILLTKNKSAILPTIRSRCHLISLTVEQQIPKDNMLISMLQKPKNDILLENIKLKKMDKSELIATAEQAYGVLQKHYPHNIAILEVWLEFIDDLKFSIAKNLCIDRWLIKITEVI